jgi:hypothetical protein
MSKEEKMIEGLVDMILTKPDKYKKFKSFAEAITSVDFILDNLENEIDHVPAQMSGEEQAADVRDEIGKDEAQKQMEESINNLLGEEGTAYQKFFKAQLKKWGVNSPSQLPDDKKKEFFNSVDKAWKGKKE